MDPSSPNQQNQPGNKGMFGMLSIGIVIVSIFILLVLALNYFNVLPLSKLLPNYLGFLPHRPYAESLRIENNNSKQGFPTPIPLISEGTKQALTSYLPTILDPSLVPASSSDINFTKDPSSQQGFIASSKTKEKNIDSSFRMSQDLKKIIAVDFYAKGSELPSSISRETTMSTAAEVFSIEPKGTWGCKRVIVETMLYCENFWEQSENSKRGLGALTITSPAGNRIVYYLCEHTKESDLYSWKSCRPEFLKTGVTP